MAVVVQARPARPAGEGRPSAGRGRSALVLGALLLGAAVVGVLSHGGRSAAPEQESALARVAAGVASGTGWVADPVWTGRPPGAVLQLAAWLSGTGALGRHGGDPVAAVREVAVLALLVTVALTWVLARRLGASRAVAAAGVVVLVVSPLGLLLHRTVSAEAVAVPWLLAACCLAVGGRAGPRAAAAAAVCVAVAVLTAPLTLLALPVVVWLVVRHAPADRRAPAVAVGTVALLLGGYALLVGLARLGAAPGPLLDGAGFGLLGPGGQLPLALGLDADPVTTVLAAAAGVLLLVRRPSARPLAAGVVGWLALSALPGVAAPTVLVVVLPWIALVLPAAALELALGRGRGARRAARLAPVGTVVLALALSGVPAGRAPTPVEAADASAAAPATAVPDAGLEVRQGVGAELAVNPGLVLTDAVRTALAAGAVDPRVLVVLPRAAADGTLDVAAVRDTDGDGLADSVLVTAVDGSPVGTGSALAVLVGAQPAPFTAVVADTGDGLLLTWPGAPPSGLLGTP
ncbi:hypothetical protein ASG36_10650 [Geodermatophilus sp. Leaf369]|uniref:hypothetical protein n=1 Tax=Geodermatophilus sp. Leaf369 TaxID=1736354 RepID=UPI0006FA548A|nr:hypothetical protein [Geodermatophilus sp. Leaf369]KQS58512.1 hypothetical protein ASG36_10650 [Geodermatophilus sp. Leaf369]